MSKIGGFSKGFAERELKEFVSHCHKSEKVVSEGMLNYTAKFVRRTFNYAGLKPGKITRRVNRQIKEAVEIGNARRKQQLVRQFHACADRMCCPKKKKPEIHFRPKPSFYKLITG